MENIEILTIKAAQKHSSYLELRQGIDKVSTDNLMNSHRNHSSIKSAPFHTTKFDDALPTNKTPIDCIYEGDFMEDFNATCIKKPRTSNDEIDTAYQNNSMSFLEPNNSKKKSFEKKIFIPDIEMNSSISVSSLVNTSVYPQSAQSVNSFFIRDDNNIAKNDLNRQNHFYVNNYSGLDGQSTAHTAVSLAGFDYKTQSKDYRNFPLLQKNSINQNINSLSAKDFSKSMSGTCTDLAGLWINKNGPFVNQQLGKNENFMLNSFNASTENSDLNGLDITDYDRLLKKNGDYSMEKNSLSELYKRSSENHFRFQNSHRNPSRYNAVSPNFQVNQSNSMILEGLFNNSTLTPGYTGGLPIQSTPNFRNEEQSFTPGPGPGFDTNNISLMGQMNYFFSPSMYEHYETVESLENVYSGLPLNKKYSLKTNRNNSQTRPTGSRSQNIKLNSSVKKEQAYLCPYSGCISVFKKIGFLNSHIKTHTKLRPHKCDYCDSAFARKHDLKRHIRIHTGDKPFKCKICDKSFSRADALSRHSFSGQCTNPKPKNK
ncbi:Krueppel-like factor 5 [Smittium culicis]|uniref:Krueppel-like factor 5 n=1 Tax=Smittium culicis TaxID=133412 RepID=A0A1R1YEN5_9FUNG|nr:Krueppel-like factor 5 [Smittium culicis]